MKMEKKNVKLSSKDLIIIKNEFIRRRNKIQKKTF